MMVLGLTCGKIFRSSATNSVNDGTTSRHDEARQHNSIAQCLPGAEAMQLLAAATAQGADSARIENHRHRATTSECESFLDDRPGPGHLAGTQPEPQEEDGQGTSACRDGRLYKGHDGHLGRLRAANDRSSPENQRQAAEDGRGHDQGAASRREISALQEEMLQRRRLRERQRGTN